jgi:hypothetical protein
MSDKIREICEICGSSKARIKSLRWEARVSLKEGIARTYPWIEAQVKARREGYRSTLHVNTLHV